MTRVKKFEHQDWLNKSQIIKFELLQNSFIWEARLVDFHLPRGQNEFIQVIFNEVKNYQRHIPEHKNGNIFKKTFSSFWLNNFEGSYEVEECNLRMKNDEQFIEIILPYLMGKISFSFADYDFISKIATAKQISESKWTYFDLDTGEAFDFYMPFKNVGRVQL